MERIRKILSALIIMTMVCPCFMSLTVNAAETSGLYDDAVARLTALGILEKEAGLPAPDKNVTRKEFVGYIVRLLGINNLIVESSSFDDLTITDAEKSDVYIANQLGIVDGIGDNMFEPNSLVKFEQAVKMVVSVLGYNNEIIGSYGGYPVGYLQVAASEKITAGIKLGIGKDISFADTVVMLDNALKAAILERLDFSGKASYEKSSDKTILSEYLGFKSENVKIEEINVSRHTIKTDLGYYDVCDDFNLINLAEVDSTVYIRISDELVCFVQNKRKTQIIYDYIAEVNGDSDADALYNPNLIEKIYFRNADREYDLSDTVVEFGGIRGLKDPKQIVNCFARAIVQNDDIVKLQIYPMSEGGIIYAANSDRIKFTRGEANENFIDDFADAKKLLIVIDGKLTDNMFELKQDMIFDYWTDEKDNYVISASSRMIVKDLTEINDDMLVFGDLSAEPDKRFGLYVYSDTASKYLLSTDYSNYLNKKVTAFIDDNLCVRYIRLKSTFGEETEFYGVVAGAGTEGALGNGKKLKIFRLTAPCEERIYPIKEKMKNSPISFESAAMFSKNLEGKGVFKFTVNGKGEITEIDNIKYFGHSFTITGMFPERTSSNVNGIYMNSATIFALLEIDGEFTVKLLDYAADLEGCTPNGAAVKVTSDFDIRENPTPKFVMLTGSVAAIRLNWSDFRLVDKISFIGDDKYRIKLRDYDNVSTYDISAATVNKYGIKKNNLIKYFMGSLGEDPIEVIKAYDIADKNSLDAFTVDERTGFFEADSLIFKNYDVVQFSVGGEPISPISLSSGVAVYELTGNSAGNYKIIPASSGTGSKTSTYNRRKNPVTDIPLGSKIWFALTSQNPNPVSVRVIIYQAP